MATVLGSLLVSLGLERAQFKKGISDTQRELVKTQKLFEKVGTRISKAGKALTVSLSTPLAALSALSVKTALEMRQIATSADVAGESFEDFQRQAFAASTVGVEFEKLGDIFKDVRDRVGDFLATGGGPMADFFENIAPKVGLTAQAFNDLSGKDALQLYFDSLRKANVSQEEMVFYLEAMASDVTNLIPLLERGGAEFAKLGEKAKIFTDEDRRQIERYQEAQDGINQAMRDLTITIGTNLLPRITPLIDAFGGLLTRFSELDPALQQTIVSMGAVAAAVGPAVFVIGNLVSAFGLLLGPVTRVLGVLRMLPIAMLGISSIAASSARSIGVLATAKYGLATASTVAAAGVRSLTLTLLTNPFGAIAVAVTTLATAMYALEESQRAARAETDNLIRSLKGLAQARSSNFLSERRRLDQQVRDRRARIAAIEREEERIASDPFLAQRDTNRARRRALEKEKEEAFLDLARLEAGLLSADRAFVEANADAARLNTEFEGLKTSAVDLGKGAKSASAGVEEMGAKLQSLLERINPVRTASEKLREELSLIERSGLSAAEKLKQRFKLVSEGLEIDVDVLRDPERVLDELVKSKFPELSDALIGVSKTAKTQTVEIAQNIAQMSQSVIGSLRGVIDAVKGGDFLGILEGVLGILGTLSAPTAGGGGSIFSQIGGIFGGARANGGPVTAGKAYMVGERGPEMVVPRQSGQVISNKDLRAANRGGGSELAIRLGPGLEAEWLRKAGGQSVQILEAVAPEMMQAASNITRRKAARPITPGGATG